MVWIRTGAILGFLAVALGAFGAHSLKSRLAATGYAAQFETGVRYQMYNVLGILAVGLLLHLGWRAPGRMLEAAPWLFLAGTLLFSGSLYALAVSGAHWLGGITPVGGALMLLGWIALALAAPPQGGG